MHHQPLLVVLRAEQPLQLSPQLERLDAIGLRHVELAWNDHPQWCAQATALVRRFPRLRLGAASVCTAEALEAIQAAGLGYAVSPVLDAELLQASRARGLALVPGVFSPSEVHCARQLGCVLVKLFPAASLGAGFWPRLRAPLGGPLPACIAAGGLGVHDVPTWLDAGVDAVALGGRLDGPAAWDELALLVSRLAASAG
ncbi:bifunctional 4-hydroxy-2-oxoglutarate aldolase/2-dehydro-3-deoxy-phosphogluconate aldolase [Cyanobium sp. CH-040]|uniref:bifunctional 4-hydroxy-2-oxoglutarate aldolase/2-dehydro-3-deoxy-phosphogluconate aldolase n=1 Tax=Cyanobium sp. CH-040 TaxID=2823708 RepID=UPI0020CF072A|nr:bifunctional 4-hydroxy-2-oxoglutarate aldolase/2-dehydro-3-deoxy-phosphogluconate aldolase [Cyanobium sp. CH-040]MCP9927326.1 bifunctional 4-hydroxy-2-oxoglutarate aldolase/2-dehydro-3-deoxy-phosphogluconate aldolase [Cyanobium sp. CH-040]